LSELLAGEIGYSPIFYLTTLWPNLDVSGFSEWFPLLLSVMDFQVTFSEPDIWAKPKCPFPLVGASLQVRGSKGVEIFSVSAKV